MRQLENGLEWASVRWEVRTYLFLVSFLGIKSCLVVVGPVAEREWETERMGEKRYIL